MFGWMPSLFGKLGDTQRSIGGSQGLEQCLSAWLVVGVWSVLVMGLSLPAPAAAAPR